ncbi:leucine-rich repeat receptor-like serine/threonine-protein kinase At1g17230 isoform X2 [Macadamia integrifolia]|uniref:leucine-rich repeat receptor-like serine/threonine-protein kinase At1g17230 isoform X2 n=1 Tax=Macadamia integrifolia TaxID=60698 RepID=UPI001C4F608F|nr:leucine-rich repeat receptor-like serine/threonine-protein kinase At1g17230 isoform X2 [Macadamia integrifolia]
MGNKLLWILVIIIFIPTIECKRILGKGCNSQDLIGLTSFKAAIHIDTSGRLEKWVGQHCCKWDGVYCNNRTGRVAEIRLPGFLSTSDFIAQTQMEGWLSPSITLLSSLEVLDLGGLISLAGTIPSSIGFHLPGLRKLYLYTNNLTGPVPESIGHIPEKIGALQVLEELDLSDNLLSGKLPLSITNLTTISVLYLDTNLLEGEIPFPSSSGEMPLLGFLRLHDNHLTGSIPSNIGNLVSLQRVSLANNGLEGSIPSSLGNLSAVTEIYLDGNRLAGQIPSSINRLSQLMFLSISNNLIEGPLPSEMSSLHNLQTLDLSFNVLNLSSIPKWLGGMPSLCRIFLAGAGIQGDFPEILRTTPSPLLELDFSFNHLTGIIPEWLGSLTRLYSLNLSSNSLVSKIPITVTRLHDLAVLDLHSNKLSGPIDGIFEIVSRFSEGSLTYIDLSDNGFSGDIEQIGTGPQCQIKFLNLSHNYLTGRLPGSVGRLVSMKSLDLSYNKLGYELPESLANLSSLEKLKLQRNRFTGQIPNGFLKLRALRELDLSDNLLVGRIPDGRPLSDFPSSSFSGNRGLCGKPLSPC